MVRAEDENLDPDQWADLNAEFYRAEPEAYFIRRLRYLVLAIADAPAVRAAQCEGVEYGEIAVPPEADEYDSEGAVAYGAMETTNLLHHLAETIMRLYLAHEGRPDCPWLEVARLRAPSEFKARLETLRGSLHERETVKRLLTVFRAATTAAEMDPTGSLSDEQWEEYADGLVKMVDSLCSLLLGEASLYNATKHGLAVVPSKGGFSLTSVTGPEFVAASQGPTVVHLDRGEPAEQGVRKWRRVYAPVPIESNIAMSQFLITQLRSLWMVARARYDHTPAGPVPYVTHFPASWIDHLQQLGNEGQGVIISQVTRTLAYLPLATPDS
jgi:hypothetical protein